MDTLRLAFSNLAQARLRTALTTLGVAIGIASLAGMVSFGVGLEDQLMGRFAQSGMFDSITVTAGPVGRPGARGRGRRGGAPVDAGTDAPTDKPRVSLDDEALTKIAALAHVKGVHPNLRVPVQVGLKEFSEYTVAAGVPMASSTDGAFQKLAHGAFFANDRDEACMISLDMARRISDADPKALIGQKLTLTYAVQDNAKVPGSVPAPENAKIQNAPDDLAALGAALRVRRIEVACPIVGIVERETAPGFGGSTTAALMIPLAKARAIDAVQVTNAQSLLRRSTEPRAYQSVTVRVSGAQRTQDVQAQIKAMGFSAFSLNDALQDAKRAFLILDIVLSLIGSIALAVSSLGIVNTMVMSILERTREIGIMKAIGGSDRDIRKIFLIEATTIGLIGGTAGVVLGWVVTRAVNFGANIYIERQGGSPGDLFSTPLWLIAGAIGFSIVVSLLAGSFPARRAARLDPIQALRHD